MTKYIVYQMMGAFADIVYESDDPYKVEDYLSDQYAKHEKDYDNFREFVELNYFIEEV